MKKFAFSFCFFLLILCISGNFSKSYSFNYYSHNSAIVFGKTVNVRNRPGLRSTVIFSVVNGQPVTILRYVGRATKIGKYKGRWAKIKTVSGKTGYMFSAFFLETKQLFVKPWVLSVGTTVVGLSLAKGFKYHTTQKIWDYSVRPVKQRTKNISGTFRIRGSAIIFSKKIFNNFRWYFYKWKGKYYLYSKPAAADKNIFIGQMGYFIGFAQSK